MSAKNNHRAVKHSRLSNDINFGEKWLGFSCSNTYFDEIKPIFDNLAKLRTASKSKQKWDTLGDYHATVYVPILDAFKKELIRLDKENPGVVAQKLVEYLVGNQDFYKVIKGKKLPGHMGDKQRTVQKLQVIQVRSEDNIVLIKGSMAGKPGALVFLRKRG